MNKHFTLLVLVTILLGGTAALNAQSELAASLTGGAEVPPNGATAFGSATFDVNFSESTVGVNYELSATNLKQAFSAHIHCGPEGANGPIVVWLAGRPDPPGTAAYNVNGPWIGSAELTEVNVIRGTPCSTLTRDLLDVNSLADVLTLMFQGLTYVNIHTTGSPVGEIRGQINVAGPVSVP